MRIESEKTENGAKCWLSPEEIDALTKAAEQRGDKHHIAVLLGSRVGMRAEEIASVHPEDKHRTQNGEYRLAVRGKDTTGETDKKRRDAYLPSDVERELLRYSAEHDIEDDETYLGVGQSRVRQLIKEAVEHLTSMNTYPGREEDWSFVSSHDLRRYFAQTLLVREGINPRIAMQIGGWSDFESLKPYLNAPTPVVVDDELSTVEF